MTITRKFRLAAITIAPALAVLTSGCGTEESTPPATPTSISTPTPSTGTTGGMSGSTGGTPDKKAMPEPTPAEKPDAKPDAPKDKDEGPKLAPPKSDDAPKTAAVKLTDKEVAAIKTLPKEDQELALKQAVCPVTGAHLGSEDMGAPIKVSAEGKTFFLCCGGCKDEVKADPKGVVAKLGK